MSIDNVRTLAVVTRDAEISESVHRILSDITSEVNGNGSDCIMALTFTGNECQIFASKTCDVTRKIGALMRLVHALSAEA